VRGDLEYPRGYGIEVGVTQVGGIGCMAGEPSALKMWGDWGGGVRVFFLRGRLLIL